MRPLSERSTLAGLVLLGLVTACGRGPVPAEPTRPHVTSSAPVSVPPPIDGIPIEGLWRAGHESRDGALAGAVFGRDSGLTYTLDYIVQCPADPCPARRERGRYTVAGHTLRLQPTDGPAATWTMAREGRTLILTDPRGTATRLERTDRYCLEDVECRDAPVTPSSCPGAIACNPGGRCAWRCGPAPRRTPEG